MKPSQQIAEEMADKIHPIWAMEDEDRTFAEIIIAEIPLPQLIEVARAAKEVIIDATEGNRKAYYKAYDALKQTGKAEWL